MSQGSQDLYRPKGEVFISVKAAHHGSSLTRIASSISAELSR
jgi:hypothetical protein